MHPWSHVYDPEYQGFYYGTPISEYEYMRIMFDSSPEEIFNRYNLAALQHNIWVYIEIRNNMPSPKQAGRIVNNHLHGHL